MRKRRKLFHVNKDVEPELSVDDILAEYSVDQDLSGVDYDTGWAEPAYDEDEDVKVYRPAGEEEYPAEEYLDADYAYESHYESEPQYDYSDDYSDDYACESPRQDYYSKQRSGNIGAMEDEARKLM